MKHTSTLFLKVVISLIGIGALAFMLWEPQIEGVNANRDAISVYFDPFLWYLYIASIPFFAALYHAFKLLGYIEKNRIFSKAAIHTVKKIKYCAMVFIGFIIGAEIHSFIFVRGTDDTAGATMLGLFIIFVTSVIATAAAVSERLLQNAVDIKSENDLTV